MCRRGRLAGNMGTEAEEEGKGGRKAHLRAQPTKKQMQAMRQVEPLRRNRQRKYAQSNSAVVLAKLFKEEKKKRGGVQWMSR